jgi:hypothetical protein
MKITTLILGLVASAVFVTAGKPGKTKRKKNRDNNITGVRVNPQKKHETGGENTCLPPKDGEKFRGQEARFCPKTCAYARCEQTGVMCCYYSNPSVEVTQYGASRKGNVIKLEGNFNEYTGNGNLGSGYPTSTGSDSYSSRYGSPYKWDQGFSSNDGLSKRRRRKF